MLSGVANKIDRQVIEKSRAGMKILKKDTCT